MNIIPISPNESRHTLSIQYGFYSTPLGELLIGSTSVGICYIGFVVGRVEAINDLMRRYDGANFFSEENEIHMNVLNCILDNNGEDNSITYHIKGTNFQIEVWRSLQSIPYGSLSTYKDIAILIGKPKAVRAVGTAIGKNPVSILIPCHRVVASSGRLGGYYWGVVTKKRLLDFESNKYFQK